MPRQYSPRVSITCGICGIEFSVPKHRGESARYCSRECRNASQRKEMVALRCRQCGKGFAVHPSRIKRGSAKFCSIGCGTTFRNLRDNPARRAEVRARISANHADVSGEKNPMHGRRGENAPGWIDGRNAYGGDVWRKIALANKPHVCEMCGCTPKEMRLLHVHHRDRDRKNNDLSNLQVLCSTCHLTVAHKYKRDRMGRITGSI